MLDQKDIVSNRSLSSLWVEDGDLAPRTVTTNPS